MVNKKELEKRIEQLEKRTEQLEAQVRRLENMHARVIPAESWMASRGLLGKDPFENYVHDGKEAVYCNRQLTASEIRNRYEHPLTKERPAWTKNISGVTFSELTQFVLDGKPIERKNEGKVTYVTRYAPGEKIKCVSTELGAITLTEKE